jgi:hypothetical protein
MKNQNKSLKGCYWTDEAGRRIVYIESKVGQLARNVATKVVQVEEKTFEIADTAVHITIDGIVKAEKAVVRLADAGLHIVIDTAKAAVKEVKKDARIIVADLKTAGHVVIEVGAMAFVKADDFIIGTVKFTEMKLRALATALEIDAEELVNFLAYLPEETLEALRRLDAKVVRALRQLRHQLRNIPKDLDILRNKVRQFNSETMNVDEAKKDVETLVGYYLNGLANFKVEGYSKSENAFIVKLTDPDSAQLAPIATAVFAPVEVDATHILFTGKQ